MREGSPLSSFTSNHSEIADTDFSRSSGLISFLPHPTLDYLPAQLHSPLHPISSPKLPIKFQVPCLVQVSPQPVLALSELKCKKSPFCLPLTLMSLSDSGEDLLLALLLGGSRERHVGRV